MVKIKPFTHNNSGTFRVTSLREKMECHGSEKTAPRKWEGAGGRFYNGLEG